MFILYYQYYILRIHRSSCNATPPPPPIPQVFTSESSATDPDQRSSRSGGGCSSTDRVTGGVAGVAAGTSGRQREGSEFPPLQGFFGEEECSLDALLESAGPEEGSGHQQELLEEEEAWRLLRSW